MNYSNCTYYLMLINKSIQSPIPYIVLLCLMVASRAKSQHTFSIVAIDTVTGEIGSAGATCGDSIIWPGTPGAYIISDILPGVGAIHTQSYWLESNQLNAKREMESGLGPKNLMEWLEQNDVQNSPGLRQYGAVGWVNEKPQAAAFTGSNCMDYKNHIVGRNYAIQGNILLGQMVLDSMEAQFLRTKGSLASKLMAAMQGANIIGADSRCTPENTSSLSAFIRVAKPNDAYNELYLDINVAGTGKSIEPIDILQQRFNKWALKNSIANDYNNFLDINITAESNQVLITSSKPINGITVYNQQGKLIFKQAKLDDFFSFNKAGLGKGMYFVIFETSGYPVSKKFLLK
ncbi:MAG: DUF1028 domain-containing protein [Bacteroidia bacterium]